MIGLLILTLLVVIAKAQLVDYYPGQLAAYQSYRTTPLGLPWQGKNKSIFCYRYANSFSCILRL
jgi:hypothetical protein